MIRIESHALHRLVHNILRSADVDAAQAGSVAKNLVWNDAAGRLNHGVNRLPILLTRVEHGSISRSDACRFTNVSGSAARLDAGHSFGQHAAAKAVERAIILARENAVGIVTVCNSHFFGTGAYFANMGAEAGMITLVCSNSFPKVAAPDGDRACLGTNPIAFGAPGPNGRHLLFDSSTSSVAGSTARAAQSSTTQSASHREMDTPAGDPVALPLTPSGAIEPMAGHFGFGVALLVEVLAGVLSGAGIAGGVASLYHDVDRPSQSGHFVLCIDPAEWTGHQKFVSRMATLFDRMDPGVSSQSTRLPGDKRREELMCSQQSGIQIRRDDWRALVRIAEDKNISLPDITGAQITPPVR